MGRFLESWGSGWRCSGRFACDSPFHRGRSGSQKAGGVGRNQDRQHHGGRGGGPGIDPLGHPQGSGWAQGCRPGRRNGQGKAAGHRFHRKLLKQGYGGLELFQLFPAVRAGGQLLVNACPCHGTQPAVHILGKGVGPQMSMTASKCPHRSTHLDGSGMVIVPPRRARCPEVPSYRG